MQPRASHSVASVGDFRFSGSRNFRFVAREPKSSVTLACRADRLLNPEPAFPCIGNMAPAKIILAVMVLMGLTAGIRSIAGHRRRVHEWVARVGAGVFVGAQGPFRGAGCHRHRNGHSCTHRQLSLRTRSHGIKPFRAPAPRSRSNCPRVLVPDRIRDLRNLAGSPSQWKIHDPHRRIPASAAPPAAAAVRIRAAMRPIP